jgi:hypothetical protein
MPIWVKELGKSLGGQNLAPHTLHLASYFAFALLLHVGAYASACLCLFFWLAFVLLTSCFRASLVLAFVLLVFRFRAFLAIVSMLAFVLLVSCFRAS